MENAEFQAMMDGNERHWWYRGRRRIVHTLLGRLDIGPSAELLDAGCGSGRTLDELAHYGESLQRPKGFFDYLFKAPAGRKTMR